MARLRILAVTDAAGQAMAGARMPAGRVQASVRAILAANVLCSMASVSPAGGPHINTVYFAYSAALEIYFLSHPQSQHGRNLQAEPALAMTVFSSAQRWDAADRGLQLFGTCGLARGAQLARAERVYGQRFPSYPGWKAALHPDHPASSYRLYRFVVTRLKLLDEARLGGGVFVEATVVRRAASRRQ